MPSIDFVIARRRKEPTWESPGTIHRTAVQKQTSYREIATPVCGLARNDMVDAVSNSSINWGLSSSFYIISRTENKGKKSPGR